MLRLLALVALVQQQPAAPQELSPGTRYDPAVPTLQQVVGHAVAEEITPPDQIVRYFEALAQAAPDRTRLVRYAETFEGRPLVLLVVGSRERVARLDQIKAGLARLARPENLSNADADQLVRDLPVVIALLHSVHGNEISGAGAALAEAYHLLAARGDTTVDRILAESLVLIDPIQNPDGRARFVATTTQRRARWPDAYSLSAEHDEPWPGGRGNHYLFDLNRDVFIQSQPETRGKATWLLEYEPQIVVDLHEMGGDGTYFFPPTAPPTNPWYGPRQAALMDLFGRANAAAFDRRGFSYFNRDVYDFFYPGYVDGWPTARGALGMTFEQASPRGLVLKRSDGDELTYGDAVLHHFTAAITTAATAARNRERILRDYLAFRREGIEHGRQGPAEYVLHSEHDPGMAERLARMLVRNGIEVRRAAGPVKVGTRTLSPRGTFIVPLSQPQSGFARNLLDRDVPMDSAFVRRQIELRAQRRPDEIYDLTAWSQSLLWDVEAILADRATGAAGEPVRADPDTTAVALRPATVGYLLPWSASTAEAVAEALRSGLRVRAVGKAFTLGGRRYPIGTAVVRTVENGADLPRTLGAIAGRHDAEVVPVDASFVEEGASLGASSTRALRAPRVLLVYDEPSSSLSAGWARYVLERRYGVATSTVRAASLGRVRLADFDVVVFPSGSYGQAVNKATVDRLRAWMRDGGTLVTLADASVWAASKDVALLETESERRGGRPAGEDAPKPEKPTQPIDYLKAIAPQDEPPEGVPGAILRVVLDPEHWLSAGTDGEIGVLVEGTRVFRPITLDHGTNVGRYGPLDGLVLSGTVWADSRPQLANKAFLVHQPVGQGQLIAFAEDPNYRAYAEATELLFVNAVLLGPGR